MKLSLVDSKVTESDLERAAEQSGYQAYIVHYMYYGKEHILCNLLI